LEWLKRVQGEQAEARQYEYSPLSEVQRWSEVARGLPLFESLLVFRNIVTGSLSERQGGGLEVTNPRAEHKTAHPLHISAEPGERFVFKFVYDTARFGDAMIGRILQHLERLIEGLVSDPRRPLSELSLITEEEQRQHQTFTDWTALEEE
jgi:non-ribosomal peptide synthetase component F